MFNQTKCDCEIFFQITTKSSKATNSQHSSFIVLCRTVAFAFKTEEVSLNLTTNFANYNDYNHCDDYDDDEDDDYNVNGDDDGDDDGYCHYSSVGFY